MRVAFVYDCLYPNSVGGAERWYRNLAERLDQRHSVTYITRRQWGPEGPATPFETISVARGGGLYTRSGRRRIWPPIRFGLGVFWHLLRHGRRYEAVHCASFPYFSLLGAALALWLTRSNARLVVDWHELWGRAYWRSYLGQLGGHIGFAIQSLCTRLPDRSFTFSRLVESRLRELDHKAPLTRLTGEYVEEAGPPPPEGSAGAPFVLSAGRQIPEKRVPSVPGAIAVARERIAELRCVIVGDGPDAEATGARVRELGLERVIELRGNVAGDEVMSLMAAASCLLHPSEREGYGLVLVEAMSVGTPSVVVRGPENAATELIEDGVNGFVVDSADGETLGDAIVRVISAGPALRASTAEWYERNRESLSMESSLATVEASYEGSEPSRAPDRSAQARS